MKPIDCIGKSLGDLAKVTGFNFKGWAVFLLRNTEDEIGARVGEFFSLREILRKYPALGNCVVKYANEYFGQTVLRVIAPNNSEDTG